MILHEMLVTIGRRSYSLTEGGEVKITISDVDFIRLQVQVDLA